MSDTVNETYDAIVYFIEVGEQGFADGEELIPEEDLAEEFGISRGTMRQVIQKLQDNGFLRVVQGKRSVITTPKSKVVYPVIESNADGGARWPHFRTLVEQSAGEPVVDELTALPSETRAYRLGGYPKRLVPRTICKELYIRPMDRVWWFIRKRMIGNRPVVLQYNVYPSDVLEAFGIAAIDEKRLLSNGITGYFDEKGIKPFAKNIQWHNTYTVDDEDTLLEIPRGGKAVTEVKVSWCKVDSTLCGHLNTDVLPKTKSGNVPLYVPYEYVISMYASWFSTGISWNMVEIDNWLKKDSVQVDLTDEHLEQEKPVTRQRKPRKKVEKPKKKRGRPKKKVD